MGCNGLFNLRATLWLHSSSPYAPPGSVLVGCCSQTSGHGVGHDTTCSMAAYMRFPCPRGGGFRGNCAASGGLEEKQGGLGSSAAYLIDATILHSLTTLYPWGIQAFCYTHAIRNSYWQSYGHLPPPPGGPEGSKYLNIEI